MQLTNKATHVSSRRPKSGQTVHFKTLTKK